MGRESGGFLRKPGSCEMLAAAMGVDSETDQNVVPRVVAANGRRIAPLGRAAATGFAYETGDLIRESPKCE